MFSLYRTARAINIVIVIGSALLTGVFGYTLGGSSIILGGVFFAIFAALSLLVPVLSEYTGQQAHAGNWRVASITGGFAAIFFLYDVATNFGTGAMFRELELTTASNANTKAKDVRNDVSRIQGRIDTIVKRTAWQTDYLAPESYDSEILKFKSETENGRNIFQRSKECSNTTLESSQRVCQGIASALANKQNAIERKGLKAEMQQLERELADAKARSADTPTVASAAMTHARNAGAFITGSMEPSDKALFWSNYGLTFSAALMCSLAGFVTSLLLGWMQSPETDTLPPRERLLTATPEAVEAGSAATAGMAYVRDVTPVRVSMGGREAHVSPEVAKAMRDAGLLDENVEILRPAHQTPADLQEKIRYQLKVQRGTIGDLITAQRAT